MSEATKQAVEDALIAHLNDEYDDPWLITQWYAIVAASNQSMTATNYVHVAPEGPLHVSLGLVRLADNRLLTLIESDDD
jgi:siroheme synthase (precorrin-2 oxidase/ferrochelatase)